MEELKHYIQQEIQDIAFTKVAFDQSLIRSKLLDSITVVDLVVVIEEKTGVHVPLADVKEENFDTINKMIDYLQKKS